MAIEQTDGPGKFKTYQDPTFKGKTVLAFPGDTMLDTGYIYAPYIPMQIIDFKETARQIKEIMRLPAKLIRNAMKAAGYKINRDFHIEILKTSATIHVYTRTGRRFKEAGVCQVHVNNGKMNIFWTYDPGGGGKAADEVDISLADPDCLKKISDTIVKATKVCRSTPYSGYNARSFNASYYGKVTI